MIDRKFIVRIRKLFFAEHWKVGTIATDLGLHHDTVKLALYGGPRPVPPPRPSALDPYMEAAAWEWSTLAGPKWSRALAGKRGEEWSTGIPFRFLAAVR